MLKAKLLLKVRSLNKSSCQKIIVLALALVPIFGFSQGTNMNNPIVMGNYAAGSFSYNDTRNNSGYGNEYGQSSEDIYYRFTVQGSTQITISTCASGFDTYLHLLNSSGGNISSNDDNGPLCAGFRASISTSLAAGTYFIVTEGYSSNTGSISLSVNLTVTAPPPPVTYDTKNFIRTWEALAPQIDQNLLITKDVREVRQSTTYFDGLGRAEQSVVKKGSLSSDGYKDLVAPVVYDAFGREAEKYLPYAASSIDGLWKPDALAAQNGFYSGASSPVAGQGESFFHAKTEFEASPLNRVTKSMAPGNSWVGSGKGVSAKYWINTDADDVKIWNVTGAATVGDFESYTASANPYPAGKLYKSVTEDEGEKQVIEFKDKEGKVILKKVQLSTVAGVADDGFGRNHNGWLCTYYIYDDLGQLRCVIQPKGVELIDPAINPGANWSLTTTLLAEQCFRYEYDSRGRMIMKKLPGAAEIWMVYDQRDRLVMTQDGKQRTDNMWMYTAYDELNRPVSTGYLAAHSDLAYHSQQAANSSSYPPLNGNFEELTRTFYDDYDWLVQAVVPLRAR
jgi:YD repeat-containing protein